MPATAGLLAYLVAQPPTIRWSITMKRELMRRVRRRRQSESRRATRLIVISYLFLRMECRGWKLFMVAVAFFCR
jgi:hypothetical protein